MLSTGISYIFSFPFRVYYTSKLDVLNGDIPHTNTHLQISDCYAIRKKGVPLSPSILLKELPCFQWAPSLTKDQRLYPPGGFRGIPFGDSYFDCFRLTIWLDEDQEISIFIVSLFLRWMRRLTKQSWITSFESQTDSALKYSYSVDELGRAIDVPYACIAIMTPALYMHPLDNHTWKLAFQNALNKLEPPTYWEVFLDAHDEHSRRRFSKVILNLSLSLEIARDNIHAKYCQLPESAFYHRILKKRFSGTDLLQHLSCQLERIVDRNAEKELPTAFMSIKELYIARHHVAHGKAPVIMEASSPRTVTVLDIQRWLFDTHTMLEWIEGI
jgi:hypothetical protein